MKNFVLAATLCAALVCTSTVFAQVAQPPALAPQTTQNKPRLIKIRNVPSSLMAYWLDPATNPRPLMLGKDESPETVPKGVFDLPGDIQQIVNVEPMNDILVGGGSDDDIRRLQELIEVLDQPLRQVEIEAQFVQIPLEEAAKMGVDFSENRGAAVRDLKGAARPNLQLGYAPSNFIGKLNAMIGDRTAKVLTAPRATAINNMSVKIGMALDIGELSGGGHSFTFGPLGADLKLTPTINGDGTITLLIKAAGRSKVEVSGISSVANLRDGNTIALAGLSPLFAPADAIEPPNILVFLTARIIHRADEPATKTAE